MKKLLAVLLTVFMVFGLVACSNNTTTDEPVNTPTTTDTTDSTNELTVGLGSVTSVKNTEATEDAAAKTQYNTTYAMVVLNADGTIAQVKVDVAQNTISFEGEVATETPTKYEKKEAYGMQPASSLEKGEWYQQIEAFEAWCVGKTVADITGAEVAVQGNGHGDSPVDLATSCTMSTGDFVAAIEKAAANAVSANGATTFGVSSVTSLKLTPATDDATAKTQADTTMSVVGLDGETVKVVITDVAQNKSSLDENGAPVGEAAPTKLEKQYDYGMAGASSLEKGEWFEQIAAYNAWCVDKTVADITGAEVAVQGNGHGDSPVDLATSCTMSTGDFTAALVKAAAVAK